MNEIDLGSTGLRAPQLGFGCSALLGRTGRADSKRALDVAWDEGIRFFDTARSYGYGESEALLGEFLRGRRSQAVAATKFGILPAKQSGWKQAVKSAARGVLAIAPWMHSTLRRGAGSQFAANQFTVAVLEESIAASLRKLETDYVDVLFLHAAPASVLEQDDLLAAMARLVEQGKVRVAGLSAAPDVVELALDRRTQPLRAMQFPGNVLNLSAVARIAQRNLGNCLLVANQPFAGTAGVRECRQKLRRLATSERLTPELRSKLDPLDDAIFADVVFSTILRGTGIHVAIAAMMRPEHIRANVRALRDSRFSAEEIAQVREAMMSATQA